nr:scarecrow-like protein 14 [Quercus suber]
MPSNLTPTLSVKAGVNLYEDYDFSDVFLKHINQILLEEDMEEKDHEHQGSIALEAAEKSFYKLLGEKYPPSFDNGTCNIPEALFDSEFILQFKRGFDEARKFLPKGDSQSNTFLVKKQEEETKNVLCMVEKEDGNLYSLDGMRAKKNPHSEDVNLEEGRSIKYTRKQSAAFTKFTVIQQMFAMTLLHSKEVDSSIPCETAQDEKKAVAADNQRIATKLLKQIRQHASPVGDGMQRMAHYFANGLQAHNAGSGSQIYKTLMTRRTSAADVWKAYQLYYTAFPFYKIISLFSSKTIMNLVENETRLHIVDFGILYGLRWPSLIQQLSARPGGALKLRITRIDFALPGFRLAQRVEETGLYSHYAETLNVQFESNAIAQRWDTIQIEDLKLDNNEVLVVNCMNKLNYLLDETVVVESPRQLVLNMIRKMNPHVFIQGVENAAYGGPFFTSRFRQAFFHFSDFFEILDTYLPRKSLERMVIESESCGRKAMNVIACEGLERIERPKTYKQWQLQHLRAGFRQLHLKQEMMNTAKDWLKSCYHKDFVIE